MNRSLFYTFLKLAGLHGIYSEDSDVSEDKVHVVQGENLNDKYIRPQYETEDSNSNIDTSPLSVEEAQDGLTTDEVQSAQNTTNESIVNGNSTEFNHSTETQAPDSSHMTDANKGTSKSSRPKKVTCLKRNHTLDYQPMVEVGYFKNLALPFKL